MYDFLLSFSSISFIDPRTKPWLLSGSPGPLLIILASYLYFCLYAGPKYMKDRKPFELKNTLLVYNAIQVLLSVALVIEVSFSIVSVDILRDYICGYNIRIYNNFIEPVSIPWLSAWVHMNSLIVTMYETIKILLVFVLILDIFVVFPFFCP